jgi:ribosome recycling factor
MANPYIAQQQEAVDKIVQHFKEELTAFRTGRANPAMLDKVSVEAYGVRSPIQQVASISVPEARVLRIEPWDKSITKDIERAINEANIGVNATVDGTIIRIVVPQMTEENRRDLTKLVKERYENARVSLRSVRDEIKDSISAAEKAKQITEDDRYNYVEELDKEITAWNKKLEDLVVAKEKEIMTV